MLTTSIVAAVVTAVLVGIDIVWASNHVVGDTLSEVIRYWAGRFPLVAFAWGGLGGHFFHGDWWAFQRTPGIAILLWCAALTEGLSLSISLPMYVYFVFGAVVWAFCWPV
jgi:hypothetical protein